MASTPIGVANPPAPRPWPGGEPPARVCADVPVERSRHARMTLNVLMLTPPRVLLNTDDWPNPADGHGQSITAHHHININEGGHIWPNQRDSERLEARSR